MLLVIELKFIKKRDIFSLVSIIFDLIIFKRDIADFSVVRVIVMYNGMFIWGVGNLEQLTFVEYIIVIRL